MNPRNSFRFLRQGVVVQVRNRLGFDRDPAAVGLIEQTQNVKQRALAAAGRTDDRVHRAALELERHPAQRVHARIVLAQKAFDAFATERNFGVHEF